MSSWFEIYGPMFWLSVGGVLSGALVLTCKICYKCKISELALCYGLVKLHRDTIQEGEIDREKGEVDSIPSAPNTQSRRFSFSFGKGVASKV